jgi:membrane-associated phospholipid phosphatase
MSASMKKAIAAAFLFLAIEALLYLYVDRQVCIWVDVYERSHPAANDFFQSITDSGKSQWYLWPCGLASLFCGFLCRGKDVPERYRRLFAVVGIRAFFIFVTVAISGIIADILKIILGRARPTMLLHHGDYGLHPFTGKAFYHGMPSGHSATLFSLAFALSVFMPRLRWGWIALAAFLSSSRLMVEAHYVSDVLAGAALAWLVCEAAAGHRINHICRKIFPINSFGAAGVGNFHDR